MKHLFMSYMRENSPVVDRLAEDLRLLGVSVWTDRDNLPGGGPWQTLLRDAISAGAFFVACFSSHFGNRKSFMRQEIDIAAGLIKENDRQANFFIPVLLEDITLPRIYLKPGLKISDLQAIRLYDDTALRHDWHSGVSKLLEATHFDDPDRRRALILIDRIRYSAPERSQAAAELAAIPEDKLSLVLFELIEIAKSGNAHIAIAALNVIGKVGPKAAPVLNDLSALALGGKDEATAVAALAVLSRMGSSAAPLVDSIAELVTNVGEDDIRVAGIQVLTRIGSASARATPIVTGILKTNSRPSTQLAAIRFIARIGVASEGTVSALIDVMNGNNRENHTEAATALGAIGASASAAVPSLLDLLSRGGTESHAAISALGHIGVRDRNVVQRLAGLICKGDSSTIGIVINSLKSLSSEEAALPPLIERLCNYHPEFGHNDLELARHIASIGRRGAFAINELIPQTKEPERNNVSDCAAWEAIAVVNHLSEEDKPVLIPALISALSVPGWRARSDAARYLGVLGASATDAIPSLKRSLRDQHKEVREHAVSALLTIDSSSQAIIPRSVSEDQMFQILREERDKAYRELGYNDEEVPLDRALERIISERGTTLITNEETLQKAREMVQDLGEERAKEICRQFGIEMRAGRWSEIWERIAVQFFANVLQDPLMDWDRPLSTVLTDDSNKFMVSLSFPENDYKIKGNFKNHQGLNVVSRIDSFARRSINYVEYNSLFPAALKTWIIRIELEPFETLEEIRFAADLMMWCGELANEKNVEVVWVEKQGAKESANFSNELRRLPNDRKTLKVRIEGARDRRLNA
jgi:HEAT repeat protein